MLGIGNYLFRLIPANPILLRVVETNSKRKRDLLFRCIYLGALLGLVLFLLVQVTGQMSDIAELTKQSGQIFRKLSYAQLMLVALLSPIFTASAITQEKDSQTYDILLSTPLTNGQIVLGSLLSRLFFVVALLISGIPIFAITQVFGGVAIRDIAMSCLIACATAFITGSVAIAIACLKVGTRRTIFSFYLFILLYLSIPWALESMGYAQFVWKNGNTITHVSWFAGIHPFLALEVIFNSPTYRPPDPGSSLLKDMDWLTRWYISNPPTFFISLMFTLSFVLVMPSVLLLRRLAQTHYTIKSFILQKLHLSSGDRTRKPRYVWSNPIAWREAKTKASANRAIILRYGFMAAGITAAVILAVMCATPKPLAAYISANGYNPQSKTVSIVKDGVTTVWRVYGLGERFAPTLIYDGDKPNTPTIAPEDIRPGSAVNPSAIIANNMAVGENALQSIIVSRPHMRLDPNEVRQFLLGAVMVELAVILLILTQSAASTVTREKEDGTLDLLLSTPITSRYYIWGKLRGLVSFVMPLMAVPIISIIIFIVRDLVASSPLQDGWTVFPESILILPGTLIIVAAFASILGMQMSLKCRRTVMAVMASVGIVSAAFGGLWLCGMSAAGNTSSLGPVGTIVGSFSPFTLMAMLIHPTSIIAPSSSSANPDVTGADTRVLLFIFGWAATAVYALIVWAMYKSMVHNFDMTIRKQSS
jgi:ABC-type transport system involved in multi-copper enzyme maturation permease subunit